MKSDLGPLLGETGLWMFKNYQARQADKGNEEKKKKARACSDLIEKYIENGFDIIGKENKYNLINKFGPKKCPDQQVIRADVPHIYSWCHYAPIQWFEQKKQLETLQENARNNVTSPVYKLCSYCGSPEGPTLKHKQCAACK